MSLATKNGYIEFKIYDKNGQCVQKTSSIPIEKGIETIFMLADSKYNMDILKIYKKLKGEERQNE